MSTDHSKTIVCPRIERGVFFSWFTPLLYLHNDRIQNQQTDEESNRANDESPLMELEDLPRLPAYLTSSECRRRLETVIGKRREKQLVNHKNGSSPELVSLVSSSRTRNWLKPSSQKKTTKSDQVKYSGNINGGNISGGSGNDGNDAQSDNVEVSSMPLLKVIILRHGGTLFKISLLKMINCALSFLSPMLLGKMVSYLENGVVTSNLHTGFGLAAALAGCALCSAIVNTNSNARCLELKLKLQAALTQLVFARAISLPSIAWSDLQFNEAQVNNFVQVDVDQVSSCLQNFNDLWLLPAQIIIAFALLYIQIRIAFLAGVAVILVMIPLNSWIARAIGRSTESLMKSKDSRVKIMTEALKSINSVKMTGLEDIVVQTAGKFRYQELQSLARRKYLDSLCVFLWASTPILVPYATFITAVYLMSNDALSPSKIITTIALLNMLIFPMNAFPWVINGFVEARVSIRRLGKLLNSSDNSYLVTPDFRGDALVAKEAVDNRRSQKFDSSSLDSTSRHNKSAIQRVPIALLKGGHRFRWKRPAYFGYERNYSIRSSSAATSRSAARSRSTIGSGGADYNPTFCLELNSDLNCTIVIEDVVSSFSASPATSSMARRETKGDLWIVTGATGSGKSTLLAAILQELLEDVVHPELSASPAGRESFQTDWNNSLTNQQAIQLMGPEQQSLMNAVRHSHDQDPDQEMFEVIEELGGSLYCEFIPGGVSYCSQVPVLFSGTIRSNILMGQDVDEEKYQNILEGCGLLPDLQSFWKEEGDMTDVGNMGSNVSGGQRLRIGLARALYACSSVVLLDDPISALDAETAKHVLRYLSVDVVGRQRRSIVLTTHSVALVDRVVVQEMKQEINGILILQDGKEVIRGNSLSSLLASHEIDEYFRSFLMMKDTEGNQVIEKDEALKDGTETNRGTAASSASTTKLKTSEKKNDTMEERKSGAISSGVYWQFVQSLGIFNSFLTVFSTVCMQFSSIAMSLFLGYWAGHLSDYSDHRFMEISTTIVVLNVFFTIIRSFLFAFASLRSCRLLYDKLSTTVMNTSVVFFEQTSIGSVINRFGKDTNTIDDSLPFILNILLAQTVLLLGSFVMMAYTNPMIIVLIIIVAIGYYRLQTFYRQTSRELRRLESAYRSPVYTLFTENVSASTAMRALHTCRSSSSPKSSLGQAPITGRQWRLFDEVENEEDELALHSIMYAAVRQLNKAQDKFIRASIAVNIASQWLGIRMQLLGVLITTVLSISIILNNCYSVVPISASLAGLSLIYSYSIVNNLNGFINALAETEQEMVSVERVLDYVNHLPSEYTLLDDVFNENSTKDSKAGSNCCSGCCSCCLVCCNRSKRDSTSNREYAQLLGKENDSDSEEEIDLEHGGMMRGSTTKSMTQKLIIDDEVLSQSDFPIGSDAFAKNTGSSNVPSQTIGKTLSFFSPSKGIQMTNIWMKYESFNSTTDKTSFSEDTNGDNNNFVLQGITLNIPSGSRVVIVGKTGSGKSSLLRCLLRLNEHDHRRGSSISFGQQDLLHIPKRQLRKNAGVIPQQPVLFSGTLRFNVDPYGKHSNDEIMQALYQSNFLQTLSSTAEDSDGNIEGITEQVRRHSTEKVYTSDVLDSMMIVDGGENLSYGQRQLLCLCRSLLRRCDLILVDEVSASLDNQTKEMVYNALDNHLKRFPHSILLMVSHQLDHLKPLCNKVLRMDGGRVIEFQDF